MGLFDIFDSGPGQQAADQAFGRQKQGLNQGFQQAAGYSNQARGDINKGMNSAYGFIDQGTNKAAGQYGKALGAYDELYPGAVKGFNAYGDAFGLGGAEGYDRARESFQTGPGYEFMMNQGLDALDRRANSRGMLASGNNQIDTLNYATGLADQQWDDYTSGLSPYLNLAPQMAGAQGDLYSQLASLYSNQGANKANIATGGAGQKAGLKTGLGNLAYETQTGIGQAGAQNSADRFAAEQGANQNLWGAIMGIGQAAASAAPMLSDERVKTDVERVGQLDNGLPVYLFRYKSGGPMQIGLMAQDVEKVNPDAVAEHDGMKHVFYGKAAA